MIPISLKLSGFISYLEPVTLDFRGIDVACISGSNGAGKSTLLDAMTWAMFGVARKRDDSLIHTRAKTAEVTLDFIYEGNTYRILRTKTRDKPSSLEFLISQSTDPINPGNWKPFTEKGTRETEASVQQMLHMDYDTFINASFFLQGKADLFAQQRPADRKQILASILGLDTWDKYRERASERRKKTEEEITRLDGLIHEIKLELDEEPERIRHLEQVEIELNRLVNLLASQSAAMDNLKQLETQMKAQQKLLNALTNQRDSLIQSIARLEELIKARSEEQTHLKNLLKEAEHIEKAHQTHLETVQKLENMEAKSINFHDYQARRTAPMMTIEAERVRLEAEYSQLESMRTVTEGAEKELSLLEPKLSSDTIKMGQIKDAICERADLESDLKAKERQLAQLQVDNESLRSAMNDLDERIKSLEPVEGSVCPTCGQQLNPAKRKKLIVELKTTGKQLGDNYRKNKAELKTGSELVRTLTEKISTMGYLDADLREVTRTVDQLETRITQIRQQIADWHSTGKQRLDDIKDSLDNNSYAMDAQAQLQMIDKELHALGYDAAAHEAVRLLIQDAKPGEEEFRELGKARSALVPLEREMKGYAEQLKQEKSNLNGLEKEIGQAESNYSEAVSKLPDVEQAYNDMLNLQQQERQQHMEVGAARQKVEILDTLRLRLNTLQEARETSTGKIAELRILERAFGKDGVPALLIEQALPDIEAQANQILDQLSDGNMSVRFSTQRDYKDKARDDKRETLDIIISDANGTRDYEMYSGGETFRINFAIRMALSKVLAQRAGARLQTLVIDEGFGSQDEAGRQHLIEAINTIRPDFARILVITHMEELKDVFPTRIEVEKTPQGSKITVF